MKICIFPDMGKQNLYIKNMIGSVQEGNEFIDFRTFIRKPTTFWKIDVFHFNWIENDHFNSSVKSRVEYYMKKIFIYLCRGFGKRIVWTYHNKRPHDNGSKYVIKFMDFMTKKSDCILIHCKESYDYLQKVRNKVIYVPHGNYIGSYKESEKNYRRELGIGDNEFVYLFIGQIKPYKNIEVLIESFNRLENNNSKLLIVGNCKSNIYKEQLSKLVKNKNIIFEFKFVPDDEITTYLNTGDIVVLPYDINSSLNSGTIIMAFSYKKTVISPLIGTLRDIDSNFYYSYSYKGINEHITNLSLQMYNSYDDYMNDKLKEKNERAYEYVLRENSWKKLLQHKVEIYGDK
ncbi:glycosyltransferase [Clostridium sp.]|uniref:glycosyltransferase n=1 Tax=Clostridium sp. TaxID=1506 RepID=UPI0029039B0A|nr:glycosyltransferase [Clostridium sp.]MDU1936651.1 glycosyltransferase [Clostridium sp.]